jgi:hypothetical protein
VDVLIENGFDAHAERNGDVKIKIRFKERVLDVLSILNHECIDYENIDIRRSNLEEIFLKITGAKLSEAE